MYTLGFKGGGGLSKGGGLAVFFQRDVSIFNRIRSVFSSLFATFWDKSRVFLLISLLMGRVYV